MGAPEMVLLDDTAAARARANELASDGRRVLVLARTDAALAGEELPAPLPASAPGHVNRAAPWR